MAYECNTNDGWITPAQLPSPSINVLEMGRGGVSSLTFPLKTETTLGFAE